MQGKDIVISTKEKDELTKELFKDFKINENINLTEKVYNEILEAISILDLIQVSLYKGDITRLEVDAIVNSASPLSLGDGISFLSITSPCSVDMAINMAAGPYLQEENRLHVGCQYGEAVISGGYRLPAKCKYQCHNNLFSPTLHLDVISTVSPHSAQPNILKSSYINSLEKMKEAGLKSIVSPTNTSFFTLKQFSGLSMPLDCYLWIS